MRKIMFDDRLFLTKAVLEKVKWKTRRKSAQYSVGEIVAIAQSYKDAGLDENTPMSGCIKVDGEVKCGIFPVKMFPGWKNKMFVKASLMKHHIRITGVKTERLQDISETDAMDEGVRKAFIGFYVEGVKPRDWEKESHFETPDGVWKLFPTAREAFKALICKMGGKKMWNDNPMVYAYEFEVID